MSPQEMLEGIICGYVPAEEALYSWVMRHLKRLQHRCPEVEVEDALHGAYIDILIQARTGNVCRPERFAGYIQVILDRSVSLEAMKWRQRKLRHKPLDFDISTRPTQEKDLIARELSSIADRALRRMRPLESEVLTRFYVREEDTDTICAEMGLSSKQVGQIKWRSKNKLALAVAA